MKKFKPQLQLDISASLEDKALIEQGRVIKDKNILSYSSIEMYS